MNMFLCPSVKKPLFCYFVFVLFCLSACSGEGNLYRDYPCSFTFDMSLHPLPCHLTGVIGNPGCFCKVESYVQQGVRHVKTTRNFDGAVEDLMITTEKEKSLRYDLGANNCIIVGTGSFGDGLIAYEGQCANCLDELGGTRYPLTWQLSGTQLHCAKCGRSYDINTGVIASGSPGRGLYTYRAATNGTILRVYN